MRRKVQLPYVHDPQQDAGLKVPLVIRQARKLLSGEGSVGCAGRCKFCQYSATRSLLGGDYSAGSRGHRVVEDRWSDINPKTGNQTTALDGWSESTRRKVGKPVTDEQIVDKLSYILASIDGIMRLKVFQIVGFPWETAESLREDILRFRDILGRVKVGNQNARIMMMMTVTPFSPEPLTAMEDCAANIEVSWRDILLHDDFRCVFDSPHLNAFILPQIPGATSLYKRVAMNRIADDTILRNVARAKTIDEAVNAGGDIHTHGAGYRISSILKRERREN